MSHFRKIVWCGGLAGAALVLSGCVVAPYPYRPYQAGVVVQPRVVDDVEYVQSAPPAPYQEVITVSPGVGYVWLGGSWFWSGGRHQWRAGYWSRPPVGYSTWQPHSWGHVPGRGWYNSGGRWR